MGDLINFILVNNKELVAIKDDEFEGMPEGGKMIAQFNKGEDVEQFYKAIGYLRPDIEIK